MSRNDIYVQRFLFTGAEESNVFIAACRRSREAWFIDAGGFNPEMINCVDSNAWKPVGLFITHNHYDHTDHMEDLLRTYPDITVFAHSVHSGKKNLKPDDGAELMLGELPCAVHHVPGHTDDMLVVYIQGHLFTGDSLFAGSVGGTSSELNFDQQIGGIKKKLMGYPDDTVIHPGHGPDSTIGLERLFNPFLSDSH